MARVRNDCDKDFQLLLAEFLAVRRQSATFLASLREPDLHREGVHPKLGKIKVSELLHE